MKEEVSSGIYPEYQKIVGQKHCSVGNKPVGRKEERQDDYGMTEWEGPCQRHNGKDKIIVEFVEEEREEEKFNLDAFCDGVLPHGGNDPLLSLQLLHSFL